MFHLAIDAQGKAPRRKGKLQQNSQLKAAPVELLEVLKKEELNKFLERNKKVLRNLERAYISARYVYEEFLKKRFEEALKALKELKEFYGKIKYFEDYQAIGKEIKQLVNQFVRAGVFVFGSVVKGAP